MKYTIETLQVIVLFTIILFVTSCNSRIDIRDNSDSSSTSKLLQLPSAQSDCNGVMDKRIPAKQGIDILSYGTIPFGKTVDEVQSMLQGMRLIESKDAKPYHIASNAYLRDKLADGFYTDMLGIDLALHSKFVKKYAVGGKDEFDSPIGLFFVKTFDPNSPYTLFLVEKFLGAQGNESTQITSSGLTQEITKIVNATPAVVQTKFQDNSERFNNTFRNGFISEWHKCGISTYLLVPSGIFGGSSASVIYMYDAGWQQYLTACQNLREQKAQDTGKDLVKGF